MVKQQNPVNQENQEKQENRTRRKSNQFLFLYPIDEYFDYEIRKGAFSYSFRQSCPTENAAFSQRFEEAETAEEKEAIRQEAKKLMEEQFRPVYARTLNACIKRRYREKDFGINFAVFDGHSVSDMVSLHKYDKVFSVGLDFNTHVSRKQYPDADAVLNQVGLNGGQLIVAGFHMWNCVEKVAQRAHERGANVLVDEDLTEFLSGRINFLPKLRTDRFPSYNPRMQGKTAYLKFIEARKGKPWLWQKY